MIASRWRNVATVVTSIVVMLFAMVKVILALSLNLRSEVWVDRTDAAVPETTRLITGIVILMDSLFVFPAAWTGISASVSRSRGVYIALVVITSLAFLGSIGGIVAIGWRFGVLDLFRDTGSVNDELAIILIVLQSLVVVITVLLLIFGVLALLFECPEHPKHGHKNYLLDGPQSHPALGPMISPSYPKFAAGYQSATAGYQSATAGYQPATTGYQSAPRPASGGATSAYRPLTQGSPEWDRFYEQYFGNNQGYTSDYKDGRYGRKPNNKHRSQSFRY